MRERSEEGFSALHARPPRCGAGYDVKSAARLNSRNGYRDRTWDTRAGHRVEFKVPKLRQGKLRALMDEAEHDALAFMTFPKAHWSQICSTNPLERLNVDLKRRTNVVGSRDVARH